MPPKMKQELITDIIPQKKKRDRFNGRTEEEVLGMKLPDHLQPNLDIIIIGINPGLTAAYIGHHYAGPGNHFWKCLYLSGLIPEPMNAYDDAKLLQFGIGFTNIVERTSRGSADLSRKEIQLGAQMLQEKIANYQPKIAVFNGKGIYEVFCGHKNFFIGKQPDPFPGTNTIIFVMPSSSARCSQLPRAVDKVPFYVALKKLRDYINGHITDVGDSDFTFPNLELKVEPKKEKNVVKVEGDDVPGGTRKNKSVTSADDNAFNNNTVSTNSSKRIRNTPTKRKTKIEAVGFNGEVTANEVINNNNGSNIRGNSNAVIGSDNNINSSNNTNSSNDDVDNININNNNNNYTALLNPATLCTQGISTLNNNFIKSEPQLLPPPCSNQNHRMYNSGIPFQYHSNITIKQEVDGDGCLSNEYQEDNNGKSHVCGDVNATGPYQPTMQSSVLDLSVFRFDKNRNYEKLNIN